MNITIKNIIFTAALTLMSLLSFSQEKKTLTSTFWVAGICAMCEETIEKTMDTKGVISSDYDLPTNKLTVTYKPAKISIDEIHHLLNEAGYDTERSACTDDQYGRVHGCCRYREEEKH